MSSAPVDILLQRSLRCVAHSEGGAVQVVTDGPGEFGGLGSAPNPMEVLAMAVGSCVLTTLAIAGRKHGLDLEGASARVVPGMAPERTPRLVALAIRVVMPAGLVPDAEVRARLERAASRCPVKACLAPGIETSLEFVWPQA